MKIETLREKLIEPVKTVAPSCSCVDEDARDCLKYSMDPDEWAVFEHSDAICDCKCHSKGAEEKP